MDFIPLVLVVAAAGPAEAGMCRKPVPKARVYFPSELMLDNPDLVMYSGYVNVTPDDYLFYWFFRAMEPKASEAPTPVILWTNGGPGCSSMEGATEIGPLALRGVKRSRDFSGKLSFNRYAWNRRAHVLIVDQPRYVGFSTGRGRFINSSAEAALDMVEFLRGWQMLFPEIDASFVLAGESYAGHFVPAWAKAIADYNRKWRYVQPMPPIRIAGIALSSACVDEKIQSLDTLVTYTKQRGLLPEYAEPRSLWEATEMMAIHLNYRPNTYDYTLRDAGPCCGCYGYNYSNFSSWFSREDVLQALHVCENAGEDTFAGCAGSCMTLPGGFDKGASFDNAAVLSELLDLGIPVLLMYGMKDLTCNFVGGYELASSLQWAQKHEFSGAPVEAFHRFGQKQSGGGLTFVQIEEAGHMCPADTPEASHYAIDLLLDAVATNSESTFLRQFRDTSATPRLDDPSVYHTILVLAIGGLALSSLLMLLGLRFRIPSLVLFGRQTKAEEQAKLARSPSEAKCLISSVSSTEDLSNRDEAAWNAEA